MIKILVVALALFAGLQLVARFWPLVYADWPGGPMAPDTPRKRISVAIISAGMICPLRRSGRLSWPIHAMKS